MAETLFEELKRYVGWCDEDERAMRALHPIAAPEFPRIAKVFYDRILTHDEARTALEGGESQVGRLKVTLIAWMDTLLTGPWDEAYYERRARIGRVHVRIALPQHYMFGAMNVIRRELNAVIDDHYVSRPDELLVRRRALSKMIDLELAIMLHTYREDLLSQQARVERLSTFGTLVGSIGHELRNPLSVIETSLYILKNRVGTDERAIKHTERITEQVKIANDIVTQLLEMIREKPLAREGFDLGKVVRDAVEAVTRPDGVALALEGLDGLPELSGDPRQLRQVFVNLIDNAVHAASPTGHVWVRASVKAPYVHVQVEDTGPGVDPAIRNRLFEPLITTKAKGIGLGLSLVKRIIERHGGVIAYESRDGGGARFLINIPVASP